ncbi:MAK10-like protein, partial [Tanacetum coccineum]
DITQDECESCLSKAIVELRKTCPHGIAVIGYYNIYYLTYSNSSDWRDDPIVGFDGFWKDDSSASIDDQFNEALRNLLEMLVTAIINESPLKSIWNAFGRHLKEIHVTWTQFGKKQVKIETLHEDDQEMAYSSGSLSINRSVVSYEKNIKKSWQLIEDLALYDNESWNDPRDFAKPVKAISLPHDVPNASDRRLIELENQVQRLMEAHIAPKPSVQVNKIASSFLAHAPMYNAILDKYVESLELGKNGLAFIKGEMPKKMKDPILFTLPCRLGDSKPFDTLADLGSYVNIIPLYLFKKLKIRFLEETDNVLGLTDGTKSYLVGGVSNVEIHVGKLKLLEDFYVVDMKNDPTCPLLVGRGFLATASVVIDCKKAKIAIGE